MLSCPRACLKIAFCQLCVTICGRFDPNEGDVVGYVDRMRGKDTAKWGVQMAGMNFQTRSRAERSEPKYEYADISPIGGTVASGDGVLSHSLLVLQ